MTRLPDFLVVGTQKSGTTLLDALLREHPGLFLPSEVKEVHFFDVHRARGLDWYAAHFAGAGSRPCGETTPDYLFDERAFAHLVAALPGVRLLVVLRDPVERLLSNHRYARVNWGIDDGLLEWVERLPDSIDRSRYAAQLERAVAAVGRERLHVVLFEDLRAEPEATMAGVYRFVGVDDGFVPSSGATPRNVTTSPRSGRVWAAVNQVKKRLVRSPLHGVVRIARDLGLKRLFFTDRKHVVEVPEAEIDEVARRLAGEVEAVGRFLGRDLTTVWTTAARRGLTEAS